MLLSRQSCQICNSQQIRKFVLFSILELFFQAVERIGRSALKDGKIPDDLLILSCEEDYRICEPFLEKG